MLTILGEIVMSSSVLHHWAIRRVAAAALFSSRCLKKFENEKIFLCLKMAEIYTGGSILGREERFWT